MEGGDSELITGAHCKFMEFFGVRFVSKQHLAGVNCGIRKDWQRGAVRFMLLSGLMREPKLVDIGLRSLL